MRKSVIGIYFLARMKFTDEQNFIKRIFSKYIWIIYRGRENKIVVNNYNDNNIFLVDGKIICENYEIDLVKLIYKKISFWTKMKNLIILVKK